MSTRLGSGNLRFGDAAVTTFLAQRFLDRSHFDAAEARRELIGRGRNTTPLGARRLIDVALRHPQVKLVVSALGQPQWLMEIDVIAVIPE